MANVFDKLREEILRQQEAQRKLQVYKNDQAVKAIVDQPVTASTVNYTQGNAMQHPMQVKNYLLSQQQMLQNQHKRAQDTLNQAYLAYKTAESSYQAGLMSNESAKTLNANMNSVFEGPLRPGNIGDINQVIWDFMFSDQGPVLAPNQSAQGQINITQEAAFILMSIMKVVYVQRPAQPGEFDAVDPEQPGAAGKSNNLTMQMRDSSSSRVFQNRPININEIGYWKSPTVLPVPMLFLPNSNIEITYFNNDPNNTYKVFTTMVGLRVRIEYAQSLLGTING